jgi:hypothetical protein
VWSEQGLPELHNPAQMPSYIHLYGTQEAAAASMQASKQTSSVTRLPQSRLRARAALEPLLIDAYVCIEMMLCLLDIIIIMLPIKP